MQGDFLSWGLPVGRVAGIRVRIHWTLLAWWIYELERVVRAREPVWVWPLCVALSFGAILLHEFGHCVAARRMGGAADRVLLWPLGGLAMCDVPNRWDARLVTAAGGPLVTAAIVLGGFGVSLFAPAFSRDSSSLVGSYAYEMLVPYQCFLLLFNLIPAYPLDGGSMLHAGLWRLFQGFGRRYDTYLRASIAVGWLSRVIAVGGIVYGILAGGFLIVCVSVWCLLASQRLMRVEEAAADESRACGYDFSEGYTSLERGLAHKVARDSPWRRVRRRLRAVLWRFRWGAPVFPPPPESSGQVEADPGVAPEPDVRERVDALLAKISAGGMESLAAEERAFLENVGRRWSRPR
jgi:Zn-dependent protease